MHPATEELLRRWREGVKKTRDWRLGHEMYSRGVSLSKIAVAMGVKVPSVCEYAKRHRWVKGEPLPPELPPPPQLPEGVDKNDLDQLAGSAIQDALTSIAKRASTLLPSEVLQVQKVRETMREEEDRKRSRATRDGAPSLEWLTRRHADRRANEAAFQKRLEAAGVTLDEVAGVLGRGGPNDEPNEKPNSLGSKASARAEPDEIDEEPTSGEAPTPDASPPLSAPRDGDLVEAPAPEDVGRIAARAGVQVRTVTRAYKDADVEEYLLVRVMQAARALGLEPPRARDAA